MDGVMRSRRLRALAEYGFAAAASIVAAVLLLRLWRADLRVPFDYHGDVLYFAMLVKAVVEEGWYLTISHLGAPGVLTMHDFPSADALHLVAVKAMSLFSSDWALIFNVYFLLGYPLITICALAVFRHFGVAYAPAVTGSLLYAFLPRHVLLAETHYTLDMFYQVPLAILVALWVCDADPPVVGVRVGEPGPKRWPRFTPRRGRSIAALVICLLVSATGIYYAFFAGVLILLGGFWASLARRTSRNALASVILAGTIVAGLGVQAVPNIVHLRRHGANLEVAARHPGEAEVYGMRIAQLLVPVRAHRNAALNQLRRRYDAAAPFRGESSMTALGIAGSVGFLVLLGLIILPLPRAHPRAELSRALAVLNLLAVLVATTGGFGSLFALLVTPQIRTYLRMQVFIAFLALFVVVLLVERACRWGETPRGVWLARLLPPVVLVLGLLDQVTPPAVRAYAAVADEYGRDRAFVRRIEAALPASAMIFDLPYQPFPEASSVGATRDLGYDPLRLTLHSSSLRWSYPAMKGRAADFFARTASERPAAALVRTLSDAGFDGIVIDRHGYDDKGKEILAALGDSLGEVPAISADDRLIFFDLTAYNRRAFANLAPEERERRRQTAVYPIQIRWGDGFYAEEHWQEETFRWSSESSEIEIVNDSRFTRRATLTMLVGTPQPPSLVIIRGGLLSESVAIAEGRTRLSRTFEIPPGRHRLHFNSSGPPAVAPGDRRRLVWCAYGTTLEEAPPP